MEKDFEQEGQLNPEYPIEIEYRTDFTCQSTRGTHIKNFVEGQLTPEFPIAPCCVGDSAYLVAGNSNTNDLIDKPVPEYPIESKSVNFSRLEDCTKQESE